MPSEPGAPDRPFPGARSQVPGTHYEGAEATPRQPAQQETLALESSPAALQQGWSVRLPVRAEQIRVDKQVVVYERVQVDRREVVDQERVRANVRKEELRVTVDRDGGVSPSRRGDDQRVAE